MIAFFNVPLHFDFHFFFILFFFVGLACLIANGLHCFFTKVRCFQSFYFPLVFRHGYTVLLWMHSNSETVLHRFHKRLRINVFQICFCLVFPAQFIFYKLSVSSLFISRRFSFYFEMSTKSLLWAFKLRLLSKHPFFILLAFFKH